MSQDPLTGSRYSLVPLFLIALLLIVGAPVCWLLSEIHPESDVVSIDYENAILYQKTFPFHRYTSAYMNQGVLPLWNPRLYCGTPLLADFSNGLFQPLNTVFLMLPTGRAMAAHAFLALCLSGFFFVLFCRALGLSYVASLVGGVALAFSGAALAASTRPTLAGVFAWAPMAFWALREFKNTGRMANIVLLGIACALMILSGGWALAAVMLMFLALYAVMLFYHVTDDVPLPRFTAIAALLATALGLSAIQWAPSLPWLLERAEPWTVFWRHDLAAQTPADLSALLRQMLAAQPGTLPRLVYAGIAVVLLIPAGLFYQHHRRDVWFFALAAPAAFAFMVYFDSAALGQAARLAAFPAVFSMCALAAMGMHRLTGGRRGNPVWHVGIVVFAVACGLFVLTEPLVRSTIILFVVVVFPALLIRHRWVARISACSIAFLLFFDLTVANTNKFGHPFQDAPACYTLYNDLFSVAEERSLGARTLISSHPLNKAMPDNIAMIYAMYSAGGSHVPLTAVETVWWDALTPDPDAAPEDAPTRRLLDVMSVRAVLHGQGGGIDPKAFDDPEGALENSLEQDGTRLIINDAALPRVYFVPGWVPVDGIQGALELIRDPAFDPTQRAMVDLQARGIESLFQADPSATSAPPAVAAVPNTATIPAKLPDMPPPPTHVETKIASATTSSVTLHVSTPTPGITILSDTFAPGWIATLDGTAVPILRANGLFRGVATPPGHHTIVFTYRPVGLVAGAALSFLTLIVLMIFGLRALFRLA